MRPFFIRGFYVVRSFAVGVSPMRNVRVASHVFRLIAAILALFVSSVVLASEIHPTGGYLLRETFEKGWTGCESANNSVVTVDGVSSGTYCRQSAARSECVSKFVPGHPSWFYSMIEAPSLVYPTSLSTDSAAVSISKFYCRYTGESGITYNRAYSLSTGKCPLSAPVPGGQFPHHTCTCPGQVVGGKCFPPPNPCLEFSNQPPKQYGCETTLPPVGVNPQQHFFDNCGLVPSSICDLSADVPDLGGKGCLASFQTLYTRTKGLVSMYALYQPTSAQCYEADYHDPVPSYPSDPPQTDADTPPGDPPPGDGGNNGEDPNGGNNGNDADGNGSETDPAINNPTPGTVTGTGDSEWGGSDCLAAEPDCTGDVLQCAIAHHTWRQKCLEEDKLGSDQYNAKSSLLDDSEENKITTADYDVRDAIDKINDSGFASAGSCPSLPSVSLSLGSLSRSFTVDLAAFCDLADVIRPLLLTFSWFFAGIIMFRHLRAI